MERHYDGDSAGRILSGEDSRIAEYYEDIDLETYEIRCEFRDVFKFPGRISLLDPDVVTLGIPQLLHPSLKMREAVLVDLGRCCRQIPYSGDFPCLLRP
jgi:hypothetical protein